jgi:hypothetical protein
MLLAIVNEARSWAMLNLEKRLCMALRDLETLFGFSMLTFTTLGYGAAARSREW